MSWDQYSQSNNVTDSNLYTAGGYEKKKLKIIAVVVGVFVVMGILALVIVSRPNKYTQSATKAARKVTPNAVVSNLKVADGFALSTVNSPTANGQGKSGNLTVFKVNKDGSMTQIANGSSFTPIDYLGLGIPLATQAKLTGQSLAQVQQNLANACGYNGGSTPGYIGFNGSFNPGGWQIDAGTLGSIEQALTTAITNNNVAANNGDKVICVKATINNSNLTTDKQTYISTFTLELQFITNNGALTNHTFTFSIGPNYYHSYTLDGQKIQTT